MPVARFDRPGEAVAALLAVAFLACAAGAVENEPNGYGEARFGMSVEQVEKIHPGMKELALGEKLAAPAVYAPSIRRFVLPDQKLEGTEKPVTVELRFWKDQLWLYITYFDMADVNGVRAGLEKRFGPPTHDQPGRPLWAGARTIMVGELGRGYVTVQDEAVSKKAQTWFNEALEAARHEKRLSLPAATPGQTGTAQAPPTQQPAE